MCCICVDLIKQKMTLLEAERNAREIAESGDEHAKELYKALSEDDLEKLAELLDEEEEE